ncbi:aspartate aminotransferase family protein [Fodinicola acaciae]|uniref:aspartate aminotransferase family protein n=1 Tax=Fodinicola acaciae TaxID=2681555 RepID=UPI0013D41D70|nr:aspartate aminotransferase family protein [Fodinicola acaciae]
MTDALRQVRAHLSPPLALAGKLAGGGAVEKSASGCRVELSDGRRLLDFGSYAVPLLGHRHPEVLAAVTRQLAAMPVSTRTLVNPMTAAAAAAIVEYFDGRLPRVHFGLNGADAVEVAVKLARLATGHTRVVAVEGGYHGKSLGALALTHHEHFRRGLENALSEVLHVPADDPDAVAKALADGPAAALVFEPVQGENGVVPLDPAVLASWCDAARSAGTMVIADEIQAGLRRCGPRSPALAVGLDVDALLVGKPLGGAVLPMSAAVMSERLFRPLARDPFLHTATFGGNPLGCAVVPVVLDLIEAHAVDGARIEVEMRDGLAAVRAKHPDAIAGVRGRGLLWGVDLASAALAGEVLVEVAQLGLIVSPCLSRPATIRLLPPIVASTAEVAEALELLENAIARASATVSGLAS